MNILERLKSTGYPVAYRAFKERQEPPFICYFGTGSNNFFADGSNYLEKENIMIELYTRDRDLIAEAKVKAAISDYAFNWTQDYLDGEQVYLTTYEIEV